MNINVGQPTFTEAEKITSTTLGENKVLNKTVNSLTVQTWDHKDYRVDIIVTSDRNNWK